ncbi:MAG: hypothetical protein A3H25_09200 [Sphingomonadales bacterium RIFCSPLOWO2_12_FULL_63_15]|jgi:hypothetical protein|nr:MAG: hypothetical protein A3H25_09200 [Sphingomonadales bacterium RIFCSPLOWO2_12_FULL_63_15]
MSITPEMLAAYADGELGTDDQMKVETAIAADPALAEEVAAHRALRDQLGAHFAPILDAPVPDRLTALLERPRNPTAEVADLSAARAARDLRHRRTAFGMPRWAMGGAIAASLAIGLAIGGQLPSDAPVRSVGGHLVASGALDAALTTQSTSSPQDHKPVRILLSFKDDGGRYCRGFASGTTSGIACRTDGSWALVRTQAGGLVAGGEYRQAGSANADIMAAAQGMAANAALDRNAEQAAIDAGWQD